MVSSSDPYANYSTAASLGYKDPDAEEAQQRTHAGTPGAWTVVSKTTEVKQVSEEGEKRGEKRGAAEGGLEEEDMRAFKLQRKTARVGLGETNRTESSTEPGLFRKRKGRPSSSCTHDSQVVPKPNGR